LDAYFYPFSAEVPHDVASVTKSVTSTLIGLAIEKGLLRDVHQSLLSLFPNRPVLNPDERKQKITLENLLTMQAGWDCGFEAKEARLFEMRRSPDWLQFMLDLPMVAPPGTRFAYCSGNPHVLSMVLSQVTGTNAWSLRAGSCSSQLEFKMFTGRPIRTAIPTVGATFNSTRAIWPSSGSFSSSAVVTAQTRSFRKHGLPTRLTPTSSTP
jgi:hypothetical protein